MLKQNQNSFLVSELKSNTTKSTVIIIFQIFKFSKFAKLKFIGWSSDSDWNGERLELNEEQE